MATKTGQRVAIWSIAALMIVGTLGSFLVLILGPQNQATDTARYEELTAEYNKQYADYEAKVDAQAAELSPKYYATFSQYQSRVKSFSAGDVTQLATEDIVVGEGEEITKDSTYSAYYIGWNPDGKVFDGSINTDTKSLDAPFIVQPGGVITGWSEGVEGMKSGGVRQITIPSEKAYGELGSGENIPPNTPLKFIVMVVPNIETLLPPTPSDELNRLYQQLYRGA